MIEQNRIRIDKIKQWRSLGKSYGDIGKLLGISRQWAYALWHDNQWCKHRKQYKCLVCGTLSYNKKFCCHKCFGDYRRLYSNPSEKNRITQRRYYQRHKNDPHLKAKIKEYNRKAYLKRAKNLTNPPK